MLNYRRAVYTSIRNRAQIECASVLQILLPPTYLRPEGDGNIMSLVALVLSEHRLLW